MRRPRRLPTSEELIDLAVTRGGRVTGRGLAHELGLKGPAKVELERRLGELRSQGLLAGQSRERERRGLPPVTLVDVTLIDEDGEVRGEAPALPGASILLLGEDGREAELTPGDRALVRLRHGEDGTLEGRVFKRLPALATSVVGVLERIPSGFVLRSTRREGEREYALEGSVEGLEAGDLVRAELGRSRPLAPARARVRERLGRADAPQSISLAVAAELDLPESFTAEALLEAERARQRDHGERTDLRHLELVTIDGADARDFDDAVWAAEDEGPDNPGGFRAVVAIADVAHYVRPGTALDTAARMRGTSVYFPDRVVPMLPEALSNDLCSLRPNEDRPCLAVMMRIDARGQLIEWRFVRGLMRSAARLAYEQVQAAAEGDPDAETADLQASVLGPLFALHEVLARARRRRGTIELDMPERGVVFGENGEIARIERRQRLASHGLIEEMMIAANVAAARTLADRKAPCLFRVHDKPDSIKLDALAQYAERLGLSWSRTAKQPGDFTRLLERIEDEGLREQIAGFVLRAQAQAVYQPHNIGHFGLNLRRYAHFTSPIRRYADLVVHRLLIHHLGLAGTESGRSYSHEELESIGSEVSSFERRGIEAERRALARYLALYMASQEGARFAGRVTGVQRFGLFVTLNESGAEGLVPVSSLGDDAFLHDPAHHTLRGRRYGETFGLGDRVEVELSEVDALSGRLVLRIEAHEPAYTTKRAAAAVQRVRPPGRRRR